MNVAKFDSILHYYRTLATIVKDANDGRALHTQGEAQIEICKAREDSTTAAKLAADLIGIQGMAAVSANLAIQKAKVTTFAEAEELLGKIEARMKQATRLREALREAEAGFEIVAERKEFDSDEERTHMEGQLAELRSRLDTQIELAERLVPTTSTILVAA